jgi:hypothetical protein
MRVGSLSAFPSLSIILAECKMTDNRVFLEMIVIYGEAIPEMRWCGEIDWCNAATHTVKRLGAYLYGELNESPSQLARECHADLQGYVQTVLGANLKNEQDCQRKDCSNLYLLGRKLNIIDTSF